jgi:outer membrane lipoprotein-sorting protein
MRTLLTGVLVALIWPMGGVQAAQTPDFETVRNQGAEAVLALADKRHNDFTTRQWRFKMVLKPKSGESRSMLVSVREKNRKLRLVRFESPGDVKGMSVLIRGKKTMYVYSPQTDNVRRVATHARRQTFMGSDLTFDDMSQIDFSVDFSATFGNETATHIWFELTRRADSVSQWKRLRVRLDKKWFLLDRVEYFEGSRVVKTQARYAPKREGDVAYYTKVVFTDVASGHKTAILMLSQKINVDLPDSLFTKRSLVRGL